MTGPEHYDEAERLIAESHRAAESPNYGAAHADRLRAADRIVAQAQVHATLALAAATAHQLPEGYGGVA